MLRLLATFVGGFVSAALAYSSIPVIATWVMAGCGLAAIAISVQLAYQHRPWKHLPLPGQTLSATEAAKLMIASAEGKHLVMDMEQFPSPMDWGRSTLLIAARADFARLWGRKNEYGQRVPIPVNDLHGLNWLAQADALGFVVGTNPSYVDVVTTRADALRALKAFESEAQ